MIILVGKAINGISKKKLTYYNCTKKRRPYMLIHYEGIAKRHITKQASPRY